MMRVIRAVFFTFAFSTAGCVSWPWPTLPPSTYRGTVVNSVLNVPEANAKVVAIRPALRGIGIYGDEELGHAITDSAGRFTLITKGGHATSIKVESKDGRRQARLTTRVNQPGNLAIGLKPFLTSIRSQGITGLKEPEEFDLVRRGIERLILHLSTYPAEGTSSLTSYAQRGVLSPEQLGIFAGHPATFFGDDPPVTFHWGREVLRIPSANRPIHFEKSTDKFLLMALPTAH